MLRIIIFLIIYDQKVPRHVTVGPVTGCHSPLLNNYPGRLQAQAAA